MKREQVHTLHLEDGRSVDITIFDIAAIPIGDMILLSIPMMVDGLYDSFTEAVIDGRILQGDESLWLKTSPCPFKERIEHLGIDLYIFHGFICFLAEDKYMGNICKGEDWSVG